MPGTDSKETYVTKAEEARTEEMRPGKSRGQLMQGLGSRWEDTGFFPESGGKAAEVFSSDMERLTFKWLCGC